MSQCSHMGTLKNNSDKLHQNIVKTTILLIILILMTFIFMKNTMAPTKSWHDVTASAQSPHE